MTVVIKPVITGIILKYVDDWNPFIREIKVLVQVDDTVISIPVDQRQKRFVEMEYPAGSTVELEHNDRWRIKSRAVGPDWSVSATDDFSDCDWEIALGNKPSRELS